VDALVVKEFVGRGEELLPRGRLPFRFLDHSRIISDRLV